MHGKVSVIKFRGFFEFFNRGARTYGFAFQRRLEYATADFARVTRHRHLCFCSKLRHAKATNVPVTRVTKGQPKNRLPLSQLCVDLGFGYPILNRLIWNYVMRFLSDKSFITLRPPRRCRADTSTGISPLLPERGIPQRPS